VQITNLSQTALISKHGALPELPTLYAATSLTKLYNASGVITPTERREPADATSSWLEFKTPGGWASYQNSDLTQGVGLLWEARPTSARADQGKGEYAKLSSNSELVVPALETVRLRYYLLLGGFSAQRALAGSLDKTLPPFGGIDVNSIRPDARTVEIQGWVLDNKGVEALELWVDGKKASDLSLQTQRADICAAYPGYSMCTNSHSRIGFSATYARPNGRGCEHPVEVRARDTDGNWRIIARRSISPIVYSE
jgi:hypothetical protein